MHDRGPLGRILGTLGDLLDDGLLNGSNAVKRVAEKSWHLTHGVSQAENENRVHLDDLHDLYRNATSRSMKLYEPAIARLKTIVGRNEGQNSPEQVLNILVNRYGEKDARTRFENWGLLD